MSTDEGRETRSVRRAHRTRMPDLSWMDRMACAEDPPELWISDAAPRGTIREHREATCRRCPVRPDCAEYALTVHGQLATYAGVWLPKMGNPKKPHPDWLAAVAELESIIIGADDRMVC
jgi:hypothetical protein